MDEAEALEYWPGPANEAFVLESDGEIVGTY